MEKTILTLALMVVRAIVQKKQVPTFRSILEELRDAIDSVLEHR